MPSPRAHRAVAGQQGRQAAQRALVGSEAPGGPDWLDGYLQMLAKHARQTGYSLDWKQCFWCASHTRLRTGTLPHIGALYFCPEHESQYRTLKAGETQPTRLPQPAADEHKVHMRKPGPAGWDDPLCGVAMDVAPRIVMDWRGVTCERCLAYRRRR